MEIVGWWGQRGRRFTFLRVSFEVKRLMDWIGRRLFGALGSELLFSYSSARTVGDLQISEAWSWFWEAMAHIKREGNG